MSKFQIGQIVENKLPGVKNSVVCRVVGYLEGEQYEGGFMYRLTDARETRDTAWLIKNDRTWAAPVANVGWHDADCVVCHSDGLVTMEAM